MAGKPHTIGANASVGYKKQQKLLPSRNALNLLTKGTPRDRGVLSFAALTPSGINAPGTYADIEKMGVLGIDLKKK